MPLLPRTNPGCGEKCRYCGEYLDADLRRAHQKSAGNLDRMLLPVGRPISAIAAGYSALFGIIPMCGLPFAIAALVCGIVALKAIKADPDLSGSGRALVWDHSRRIDDGHLADQPGNLPFRAGYHAPPGILVDSNNTIDLDGDGGYSTESCHVSPDRFGFGLGPARGLVPAPSVVGACGAGVCQGSRNSSTTANGSRSCNTFPQRGQHSRIGPARIGK